MRYNTPHANDDGNILLITLVLLLLLTIAGLGALRSTNTEIAISGNDRCYKQNFTRAEAAVMEAAQTMANSTSPATELKPPSSPSDPDTALTWVNPDPDPASSTDFNPGTQEWDYGTNAVHSPFYNDDRSGYTTVYKGIAPGASLDMGSATTMRQYEIYGRSEECNGRLDVIAGYRIRF